MLLDSFFENRTPDARFRGVSRLNVRLSFYAYETRKLANLRQAALVGVRVPRVTARSLARYC